MLRATICCLALGLTGCGLAVTASRPADYAAGLDIADREAASLFDSDATVLGDAEIARILEYEYAPPALNRIAILPIGWDNWAGWSEDLAALTSAVDADLMTSLRSSPRVFDASILPSILVPKERTAPYLREAAARYQADLLLAFRPTCRSFQRYRLFRTETTRAYCSVEAVLLDVRTGLVPFVATATRNFEAEESGDDFNFSETVLRGQLGALAAALKEVSAAVTVFIDAPTA